MRYERYDLQEAVDFILSQKGSPHLRAIKLVEFLVVIHLGKAITQVSSRRNKVSCRPSLAMDVPTRWLRSARLLAAMKMLDQLERDWIQKNPTSKPLLEIISINPTYAKIYNEVVLQNGGWYRIRYSPNLKSLVKKLNKARRQARNVAGIIDFSCRFTKDPARRKVLGGVTMATDIVTSDEFSKYFRITRKKSTLEKWWGLRQAAAPFFYLIYTQKFPLRPDRLKGSKFAVRFLKKIEDHEKLSDFFSSYNAAIERLRPCGYNYSPFRLPSGLREPSINFNPFSQRNPTEKKILTEIANYSS